MAKKKKDLMQGVDVPVGGNSGLAGAYGDFINQTRPATPKKKAPTVEIPQGPYFKTQTELEVQAPGESAESTQARTARAEKEAADAAAAEKAKRDAASGTGQTSPGGASPSAPNVGTPAAGSGNKVSAFDKLKQRLTARNLGSLYNEVVGLVQADLPEEEFTFQLRATPAYQQRFKANASRIANGLTPIGEAAYLDLEDQFQNIMRKRGLPESYWARSGLGEQPGFDALIANDVSADELDSRINAAQMVINANPEVMQSLKAYYPEVRDGDVLGYVLNPKAGLVDIERKIRASQIGGAAAQAGLIDEKTKLTSVTGTRAEQLAAAGVTAEQAKQGFQSIANILPETKKLSEIYDSGGYTQAEAEAEAFGLTGGIEAGRKRRKLASQERAAFSGQSGLAGTALERGRSGAF